jgi:hypothetical protein
VFVALPYSTSSTTNSAQPHSRYHTVEALLRTARCVHNPLRVCCAPSSHCTQMVHCHIYEHSDYGVAAMTSIASTRGLCGQSPFGSSAFKKIGSCPMVKKLALHLTVRVTVHSLTSKLIKFKTLSLVYSTDNVIVVISLAVVT